MLPALVLGRVEQRWNPRLYCTDDWAAYGELIPPGRLFVGKEETHGIERDHSRQRHWLARFRRRTCVVYRAARMVNASAKVSSMRMPLTVSECMAPAQKDATARSQLRAPR